ncbi:MAG: AAA domain-containing protein, partial [Chloroflexi bacterium]|nr:AAA domain-containing protein [Chloroflexota bacterium]
MGRLAADPTKAFYDAHREQFRDLVEQPMRALMADVALKLPAEAKALLETDKNLTSHILKNDYGQGGAWPYLWGAFYPKDSKRTADGQQLVFLEPHGLVCGFYIGEYGADPRARFRRNVVANREALRKGLAKSLDEAGLVCGDAGAEAASASEWLYTAEPYPRVGLTLTPEEATSLSKEEMVRRVSAVFSLVFPLVLLTISDDPMPAVLRYLGEDQGVTEHEVADAPSVPELPPALQPPYTLEQLATDTSFPAETLSAWLAGLARKKQAILYGPPGTGKTYVAQLLARHLAGGTDGLVELVQFHPAYAYEDFVQGIRPQEAESGALRYPVVPGHFLEFCA